MSAAEHHPEDRRCTSAVNPDVARRRVLPAPIARPTRTDGGGARNPTVTMNVRLAILSAISCAACATRPNAPDRHPTSTKIPTSSTMTVPIGMPRRRMRCDASTRVTRGRARRDWSRGGARSPLERRSVAAGARSARGTRREHVDGARHRPAAATPPGASPIAGSPILRSPWSPYTKT